MNDSQVESEEKIGNANSQKSFSLISNTLPDPNERLTQKFEIEEKNTQTEIPEDFLRIPQHQAIRVFNIDNGNLEWKVVKDLEDRVIQEHLKYNENFSSLLESCELIGSAILYRQNGNEVGIQLKEVEGHIYINALKLLDGSRLDSIKSYDSFIRSGRPHDDLGSAFLSGLKPGDQILGLNGITFFDESLCASQENCPDQIQHDTPLKIAVRCIGQSKGPLVVHIMRHRNDKINNMIDESTESNQIHSVSDDFHGKEPSFYIAEEPNNVHSIVSLFGQRGFIKSRKGEMQLSKDLVVFNSRARLWKSNSYLNSDYFACSYYMAPKVLRNIRQAICVHVVNTFVENESIVYTLWVQDVESNATWYTFKGFQDFLDLHKAVLVVDESSQGNLPFLDVSHLLKQGYSTSASVDTQKNHRNLSKALQALCDHIYTCKDIKVALEIGQYVQAFLGCIDVDFEQNIEFNHRESIDYFHSISIRIQIQLHQLIRLHTFRVLLLSPLKEIVSRFIFDIQARIQNLEARKVVTLSGAHGKEKILNEISFVRNVLSSLVHLVMRGCYNDFRIIITRLDGFKDTHTYDQYDKIIENAVREQIEAIVYIPLRSTISNAIVHVWRHDDDEIEKKMSYLRLKDQSYFKISNESQSPSKWRTVIDIFSSGMIKSALPCQKMHSIVHAAKEIGRLIVKEHPLTATKSLGADEVLPIFIYCFVNSEIEKPCSLCALLRQLLDSSQQIGEIGYYMSSYEATLEYIHELELFH